MASVPLHPVQSLSTKAPDEDGCSKEAGTGAAVYDCIHIKDIILSDEKEKI